MGVLDILVPQLLKSGDQILDENGIVAIAGAIL